MAKFHRNQSVFSIFLEYIGLDKIPAHDQREFDPTIHIHQLHSYIIVYHAILHESSIAAYTIATHTNLNTPS